MNATPGQRIIPNHPRGLITQSVRAPDTIVDENGGLYITVEQLTKFGDGDPQQARRDIRAMLTTDRAKMTSPVPTAYPKSVVLAGPEDEAAILELLLIDLHENAIFIAPIDEQRVLQTVQVGTRRRGGFVGIIRHDGKPVGVTVIHPAQWWFSQGWYLTEAVTFVHPEHRKSRHSADLLAFGQWVVEQQSKAMGYKMYYMCGVLGIKRFWAKTAMYRRKYMQVGSAFLFPAPNDGRRP